MNEENNLKLDGAAKDEKHKLDTDDIKGLLFKLTLPAIISLLVMTFYTTVDTLFVSKYAGADGTAAVTVVMPVFMILNALGSAYGVGAASTFTRSLGAKDYKRAKKIIANVLIGGMICGILLLVLGLLFKTPLLDVFGLGALNVMAQVYGVEYFSILILGAIPVMVSSLGMNLINAEGNAADAAMMFILGMITNIILDPIFIFDWGLGLGVSGAAIATVIGQIVSVIYLLFYIKFKKNTYLKTDLQSVKLNMKLQKEIIFVGSPTLFESASESLFSPILIFVITVLTISAQEATIAVAIQGITMQVIMLSILLGVGIVQGMTPIISFNYTAGRKDRIKKAVIYSRRAILAVTGIMVVIIFIFPAPIVSLFIKKTQLEYLPQAVEVVRLVIISVLFAADNLILSSWYQAIGKAKPAVLVVLLRTVMIIVPLILTIPFILDKLLSTGLIGLWICFPLAYLITFIICRISIIKELRK